MLRILAATTALGVLACGARSRPEHPRPLPPSSTPPAAAAPTASPADAAPTASPADAAPTAASTYTIPVAPVTVTRLGRGQGSVQVLRYTYAVGSTQDVEQTFDASVEITIVGLGQHASQPVPTQHFGGSVVVLRAGGGAATLVITIDRASALDAQMNEQLEKLIGARIEHEVDSQGRSGDLVVTSRARDADAARTMAGMMHTRRNTIVLPTEAIGVGGSWSVVTDDDVNGITAEVTTTYTLVSRKGDLLTVTGVIAATAPAQTMSGADRKVEVKSMTGAGTVAATIDLRHPIPNISTTGRYDALMDVNGQELRVISNITARQVTRDR